MRHTWYLPSNNKYKVVCNSRVFMLSCCKNSRQKKVLKLYQTSNNYITIASQICNIDALGMKQTQKGPYSYNFVKLLSSKGNTSSEESTNVAKKSGESISGKITDLKAMNPDAGQPPRKTVLSAASQNLKGKFALSSIVNKSIPILKDNLLEQSIRNTKKLDFKSLPFKLNEINFKELNLFLFSSTHINVKNFKNLPMLNSKILVLSFPFPGGNIFLNSVCFNLAKSNGWNYLFLSNEDLFSKISGAKALEASVTLKQVQGGRKIINHPVLIPIKGFLSNEDLTSQDSAYVPYPFASVYTNEEKVMQQVLKKESFPAISKNNELFDLIYTNFFNFFLHLKNLLKKNDKPEPLMIFYENLNDLVSEGMLEEKDVLLAFKTALEDSNLQNEKVLVVFPETKDNRKKKREKKNMLLQLLEGGNSTNKESITYESYKDNFIGFTRKNILPEQSVQNFQIQKTVKIDQQYLNLYKNLLKLHNKFEELKFKLEENIYFSPYFFEEHVKNNNIKPTMICVSNVHEINNLAKTVVGTNLLTNAECEIVVGTAIGIYQKKVEVISSKSESDGEAPTSFREKCNFIDIESFLQSLNIYNGSFQALGVAVAKASEKTPELLNDVNLSKREKELFAQTYVKPSSKTFNFKKIGGLSKVKLVLNEIIKLPLLYPKVFQSGILKQTTSGVLLFGPPGTGKTSTINTKWFGESEKNVRAIFSLARKLRPCVIFIDEIDSILKSRNNLHRADAAVLNEFMQEWDGVDTQNSGIIIVGATNRPFDLDEAVLRRLPRRILINLPDKNQRYLILKILLQEEVFDNESSENSYENVCEVIAKETENFSGSDLKNLCIAAALKCIREKLMSSKNEEIKNDTDEADLYNKDDLQNMTNLDIRLRLEHFREVLTSGEVSASTNSKADLLMKLQKWDLKYGTKSGTYGKLNEKWGF
ncbi:hypothetical protein HK099_001075 [Clydaea vesicula]|uniref:AAA+ ATPase domain-containing protein n=1 Tax=Clydaea vesicula TaxID=447962 RepID=A0AAD5Y1Z7_9FUNG|nr:hypothetical protein HK099_001075 [Clydaea vesicula]